ncbi:MAG TPA: sulfatase-like hydrolase/transferase [Kribbella sp.]|jgi:arylsulfatase A-like enzyme
MTDQHRVDTLGAYGNQHAMTPVLDELARTGTRFDRWYTPTAICTPARASLLTGQAPFRHKLLANHERNVGYIEDLADGQFTFSRALREQGYNCGLIGKWHVGTEKTAHDFGFDGPELPHSSGTPRMYASGSSRSSWRCTFSGRICRTSCRTSSSTCSTPRRWNCRAR